MFNKFFSIAYDVVGLVKVIKSSSWSSIQLKAELESNRRTTQITFEFHEFSPGLDSVSMVT